MPIVLSSAMVSANAAVGTIVGALSLMDDTGAAVPANFTLDIDSGGYFAVDAHDNIVTEWPAPLGYSGFFPVRIRASGITEALDSKAHFIISVVVPSPTTLEFLQGNDMATPITSITLVEGGPAVHVTVADQTGNNPIPPANITWQTSSVVNVVADATGFNFSAVTRGTPFSFQLGATDVAQTPNVSALLTINVVLPAITGLTFLSP
jgi:hypothetical protein